MCVQVVNELRLECAGKDDIGRARSPAAVAWSLQRYLIFAILCCIPGALSLSYHLGTAALLCSADLSVIEFLTSQHAQVRPSPHLMEGIDCTPTVRMADSQHECSQGVRCKGVH